MKVVWTPTAKKTVADILRYRSTYYGPSHMKRLKQLLISSGRFLSDNPYIGQHEELLDGIDEDEYRRLVIEHNLKLVYKISSDIVYIMFLWDTSKNPENMAIYLHQSDK